MNMSRKYPDTYFNEEANDLYQDIKSDLERMKKDLDGRTKRYAERAADIRGLPVCKDYTMDDDYIELQRAIEKAIGGIESIIADNVCSNPSLLPKRFKQPSYRYDPMNYAINGWVFDFPEGSQNIQNGIVATQTFYNRLEYEETGNFYKASIYDDGRVVVPGMGRRMPGEVLDEVTYMLKRFAETNKLLKKRKYERRK